MTSFKVKPKFSNKFSTLVYCSHVSLFVSSTYIYVFGCVLLLEFMKKEKETYSPNKSHIKSHWWCVLFVQQKKDVWFSVSVQSINGVLPKVLFIDGRNHWAPLSLATIDAARYPFWEDFSRESNAWREQQKKKLFTSILLGDNIAQNHIRSFSFSLLFRDVRVVLSSFCLRIQTVSFAVFLSTMPLYCWLDLTASMAQYIESSHLFHEICLQNFISTIAPYRPNIL